MPTLSDIGDFIPNMLSAIADFMSTGICFYICSLIIFAIIIGCILNIIRR